MTDEAIMDANILGPGIGAGGAILVGLLGLWGRALIQQRKSRIDEMSAALRAAETDVTARIDVNSNIAQNITDRFKTLMDGYEARIRDLTSEVTNLREQLRRVERALKVRTDKCLMCPHFLELERDADTPS